MLNENKQIIIIITVTRNWELALEIKLKIELKIEIKLEIAIAIELETELEPYIKLDFFPGGVPRAFSRGGGFSSEGGWSGEIFRGGGIRYQEGWYKIFLRR